MKVMIVVSRIVLALGTAALIAAALAGYTNLTASNFSTVVGIASSCGILALAWLDYTRSPRLRPRAHRRAPQPVMAAVPAPWIRQTLSA